jgi:hypothetical protein
MKTKALYILSTLILACTSINAADVPWHNDKAEFRYHLKLWSSDTSKAWVPKSQIPLTGKFSIEPIEDITNKMPVIYNSKGKIVPSRTLWRKSGESLQIIHDLTAASKAYTNHPKVKEVVVTFPGHAGMGLDLLQPSYQGVPITDKRQYLTGKKKKHKVKQLHEGHTFFFGGNDREIRISFNQETDVDQLNFKFVWFTFKNFNKKAKKEFPKIVKITALDKAGKVLNEKTLPVPRKLNFTVNLFDDFEAYLYFVPEGSVSIPKWTPRMGAVQESRALKTASSNTNSGILFSMKPAKFIKEWKKTPTILGRSYITALSQGFPIHHRPEKVGKEFAAYTQAPLALHRTTASFYVPKPTKEKLQTLVKKLKEAKKKLGVAAKVEKELKVDLARAKKARAKNPANKAFIQKEKKAASILEKAMNRTINPAKKLVKTLEAGIKNAKDGVFTFGITANKSGAILVDGKIVVEWREGDKAKRRGKYYSDLKFGSIPLSPGIHTFEILHVSAPNEHFIIPAIQSPYDEKSHVVTRDDLLGIGKTRVASVESRKKSQPPLIVNWEIIDDIRSPGIHDMPVVAFKILNPDHSKKYQWDFGDGRTGSGTFISHLYFTGGKYKIQVKELDSESGKELNAAKPITINAHTKYSKTTVSNLKTYQDSIIKEDLSKVNLEALINAFMFTEVATKENPEYDEFRISLLDSLYARMNDFKSKHVLTVLAMAKAYRDFIISKDKETLATYSFIMKHLPQTHEEKALIELEYAEQLINVKGDVAEGLRHLVKLKKKKHIDPALKTRITLAEVDANYLSAQPEKGDELLKSMTVDGKVTNKAKMLNRIKIQAALRHATRLAMATDQKETIKQSKEILDDLTSKDPKLYMLPELNVIKLDLLLRKQAYSAAALLCMRLKHVTISEALRPEVMSREVVALMGINKKEEAQKIMDRLTEDYPFSPGVATARKALNQKK